MAFQGLERADWCRSWFNFRETPSKYLRSIVIDDMLRSSEENLSPAPAYFYCSRNFAEPGRSNAADIAASIVRQLSCANENSLLEPVIRRYNERQRSGFSKGHLDLDEIRDLMIELLWYYPMVTIVLDGLDECSSESREELLDMLEYILQESPTLVKVFVSSRDDQDIVSELEGYPNLEVSSTRNTQDITAFVHREVQALKTKRPLRSIPNIDELTQLIIENIIAGANGMYGKVAPCSDTHSSHISTQVSMDQFAAADAARAQNRSRNSRENWPSPAKAVGYIRRNSSEDPNLSLCRGPHICEERFLLVALCHLPTRRQSVSGVGVSAMRSKSLAGSDFGSLLQLDCV